MTKQLDSKDAFVLQFSILFSASLLIAAFIAALLSNGIETMISGWFQIMTSPAKLITDYYDLGSLSSTFFNAVVCGIFSLILIFLLNAEKDTNPGCIAGYLLVIAHCFYGLNFLNMMFPILGTYLYCLAMKKPFSENLDVAFFSTAFGPFFSELLFRYPFTHQFTILGSTTLFSIVCCVALAIFLGFTIPAILPGAKLLHKGFNLYNGGLAFGLLGMLVYSFLFTTLSVETPASYISSSNGDENALFCNVFFILVFLICIIISLRMDKNPLDKYSILVKDSGYQSDFLSKYDHSLCWLNVGLYGLLMLAYFDIVILITEGAGFTGPTTGVIFAALSFVTSGQHPKNVSPILTGFIFMFIFVASLRSLIGVPLTWTLSTQGYINAAAFATGLCPYSGKYGTAVGILAGIICCTLCTTTSLMHGGFMLYNGGLTAGITALILTPMLEHYLKQ